MLLDINDIQKIIPHRYPFLLVDCVEEMEPGVRAVGYKNVTMNEPFFQGHFPQQPVMPGVLIINAKFRKQVIPGDRLRLETEIIKCKGPMGIGKAVATVDGKLAAEAEISFMCTDAK